MKGTEPFSRLRSFQHPFKPFVAVEQWLPKGKLRPEGGCYIIIRFAFKITLVLRLAFGPSLGHEIWPLLRGPPQHWWWVLQRFRANQYFMARRLTISEGFGSWQANMVEFENTLRLERAELDSCEETRKANHQYRTSHGTNRIKRTQ